MPVEICSTRKACHYYSFVEMPHEIRISLFSSRSFQSLIRNFLFSQRHKTLWREFIINCMQFAGMFVLLQYNYEWICVYHHNFTKSITENTDILGSSTQCHSLPHLFYSIVKPLLFLKRLWSLKFSE